MPFVGDVNVTAESENILSQNKQISTQTIDVIQYSNGIKVNMNDGMGYSFQIMDRKAAKKLADAIYNWLIG